MARRMTWNLFPSSCTPTRVSRTALMVISRMTEALDPARCLLSATEWKQMLMRSIAIAVQRGNADIMIRHRNGRGVVAEPPLASARSAAPTSRSAAQLCLSDSDSDDTPQVPQADGLSGGTRAVLPTCVVLLGTLRTFRSARTRAGGGRSTRRSQPALYHGCGE